MGRLEYLDEYYNTHIIKDTLGEGGQGIVYRSEGTEAIKLVQKEGEDISDVAEIKVQQQKFRHLRFLPIPKGLAISLPMAILRDQAGYVMKSLDGMHDFKYFLPLCNKKERQAIAETDIPQWLLEKRVDESLAKDIVYYIRTGATKRRLDGLMRLAISLARLHGVGLVYGDISSGNIFMHKIQGYIWMIDADNLRFEQDKGGTTVYTPIYGAPELISGKDEGRMSSDSFAFAVLAFYVLTLVEPFVEVDETGSEDWSETTTVPTFIDATDIKRGIPRDWIFTEEIKRLFDQTFERAYDFNFISERPVMAHWVEVLAKASDNLWQCECGMNAPYSDTSTCPYCSNPMPHHLLTTSYLWQNGAPLNKEYWRYGAIITADSVSLPLRLSKQVELNDFEEIGIELKFDFSKKILMVKKVSAHIGYLSIAMDNQSFKSIVSISKIALSGATHFYLYVESPHAYLLHCQLIGARS